MLKVKITKPDTVNTLGMMLIVLFVGQSHMDVNKRPIFRVYYNPIPNKGTCTGPLRVVFGWGGGVSNENLPESFLGVVRRFT